jgi:S1-C subfamily serine protease
MSLTEEQKTRIREEEKMRLAEEQYREQVRKELANQANGSGPVPPANSPSAPPKQKSDHKILIYAGIAVALCAACILIGSLWHRTAPQARSEASPANMRDFAKQSSLALQNAMTPAKLTTEQIAEAAKPSVVVIRSFGTDNQPIGQGSGYISSADGVIVTNYHVIRGAESVRIQTQSRGELQVSEILAYDPGHDVAALTVTDANLPALQSESDDHAKVGDRVVAIGAPLGLDDTVTEGIISARRSAGNLELIQTSAAISHGSSGGPLINDYGKVIGLNTLTSTAGENLNFAVPVRYLSDLLSRPRRISFSQMLDETRVVHRFSGNSFSVRPRTSTWFTFTVNQPMGAMLTGTYEINGGGRDVNVYLTMITDAPVTSYGRVIGEGRISQHVAPGQYKLVFDNRFSMMTAKSVTPDLGVESYK